MIVKHWPLQLAHYHYEIARRVRVTASDLCYSISKSGNWPLNLLFSLSLVEAYVVLCVLVPAWDAGVPVHINQLHQVLLLVLQHKCANSPARSALNLISNRLRSDSFGFGLLLCEMFSLYDKHTRQSELQCITVSNASEAQTWGYLLSWYAYFEYLQTFPSRR